MKISLVAHKIFDYPSASAVELHNNHIYVIGDDSNKILLIGSDFEILREIRLFEFDENRIPKKDKPDFEACTIIDNQLMIFGSGSLLPQRGFLYTYHLDNGIIEKKDMSKFYQSIHLKEKIYELNIEGLTTINRQFLFFNRANNKQQNTLLIVENFLDLIRYPYQEVICSYIDIEIQPLYNHVLGISGVSYCKEEDQLFITASAENTDNAYDDGEIIGSVLCIVNNASKILKNKKLIIENYIILETIDHRLKKQKIESVSYQNKNIILVADNDNGKSEIFLLKII